MDLTSPSFPVSRLKTPGHRFGFAFAITALCVILTLVLTNVTNRGIFQLVVVAVALSAWYGGLYPGLVSAGLAATGVAFTVLAPQYSLMVNKWEDMLQLVVFIFVSLVISSLSEARHRTECLLQTRTTELEEANQELEAFSYSVSHDLRWPLRAIDGYSRILLDDYGSVLDSKGQRYLHLLRSSTQQMDRLVQDLLAFSKLSRQPLKKECLDAGDVARSALNELEEEMEGRVVEINIGTLPSCLADSTLLKQVFINLLHNALKFTRTRVPARISVGYDANGIGAYYIQDNGIGFDMKYAEKAFDVFQRLHRSEEFEGTGVGLAIVRRIITRHGGKIWPRAGIDQGATFYFTLQRDAQHEPGTN